LTVTIAAKIVAAAKTLNRMFAAIGAMGVDISMFA